VDELAQRERCAGERSAEQLAADAAAGCSASFEALVARYGPRLLRYLRQRVGDRHAAEDLLQETFLKAYRYLSNYDPSRSFATWLFTIATRLAAGHWRRRRPAVPMEGLELSDRAATSPLVAASVREQHANVWAQASRVLGPAQLAALWLRYAEEMAIAEIAEVMGRSPGSVKVLLHRACRRLMRRGAGAPGRARPGAARRPAGQCAVET
jgi:RNA polymerase sigma-70 factor (ECF subfamily)